MVRDPADHELLFALCHEMGNLVGAIRLQTHLLDQEMSPRDLATARSEIDVLGARVSALLTLVRPVELGGAPGIDADGLDPDDALAVVEHGLETLVLPGVDVAFAPSGARRRLRVDRGALQALVTSFVHLAIEQVRPRGRVRVGVEHEDGRGAVVIEDDGQPDPSLAAWPDEPKRGRTLLCAVARRVVDAVDGDLSVDSSSSGSRIAIWLPAVAAEG